MIKAAVIGVGDMGQNHARVYMDLEGVRLVAVADPSEAARRSIEWRFGVRTYGDYRQMLDVEKPDLASIAVPTTLHRQVALYAISAGVHVLVEKPMALSSSEANEIIHAAAKRGVCLAVGHIERFNPAVIALKHHLEAGELGRIFEVHSRRLSPFPARIVDVGVVLDLATHELDITQYLLDSQVESIYAEIDRRLHPSHEDMLLGLLRFKNGALGVLDINWLSPTKVRELTVTGERGMYRVDYLTQDLYFYENNCYSAANKWDASANLSGVGEGNVTRFALHRKEPLQAQLEAFVAAVRNGHQPPVGGAEGLWAIRLAELLIQAGRSRLVLYPDDGGTL